MRYVYFFIAFQFNIIRGNEIWIKKYNGPGNSDDKPCAIMVDRFDNVYVLGKSKGAQTGYDFTLIKYNPDGNEEWIRRYNSYGENDDIPVSMAIDNNNNIYVTGYNKNQDLSYDYVTIKYDDSGNEIWVKRYNGSADSVDIPTAIKIDNYGNIYVTGKSMGLNTNYDYATVKYDNNGNEIWIRRFDGFNNKDVPKAICIDNLNNVYITGYITWAAPYLDWDILTIKYDENGNELWHISYNGPGSYHDAGLAILCDNERNIFVTGFSWGGNFYLYDYITIKYNENGNLIWEKRYNSPYNVYDIAKSMSIDNSGDIYVTGISFQHNTGYDYFTIKYRNNDGNVLWFNKYNYFLDYTDEPNAITVDSYGNVYITGKSMNENGDYDYATVKLDIYGHQVRALRYNGGNDDCSIGIVLDSYGNVYITGYSYDSITGYNFVTIKYPSVSISENPDSQLKPNIFISSLFKDFILIKFLGFKDRPLEISIYNSCGSKIFSEIFPFRADLKIENQKIKTLHEGVYFLKIFLNKKEIGKFKIIKQ